MLIREAFSNTISLPVTNEYDAGAVMENSTTLGHVCLLLSEACSETALPRHLSYYVFGVRNFKNTKSKKVIF